MLGVSGIGTKTAGDALCGVSALRRSPIWSARSKPGARRRPALGKQDDRELAARHSRLQGRQRRTPLPRALAIAHRGRRLRAGGTAARTALLCREPAAREVTVGDIDIVCTSQHAADVVAHFASWSRAEAVLAEGPTKASIWLPGGLQIDLRVLPDHLYGNLLQHFTGSREHNIKLREYAVRKSLRVSENGILDLETGEVTTCGEEAGVYAALGMQYIPPEMRSGLDEIDLALARRDSRARRDRRSARRLSHAHDVERRRRYARGDDRRRRGTRLRVSRDQRPFAGPRAALRLGSRRRARTTREIEALERALRDSHALRERGRHSARRLARLRRACWPSSTSSSERAHRRRDSRARR